MVAVIDTGANNVFSIVAALRRLGARVEVMSDASRLSSADRIVLPGVGHAAHVMPVLERQGFADVLRECRVPLLGICLGMQLLFESTDEGNVDGIGLFKGRCTSIPASTNVIVPHIGWNTIHNLRGSLFANITTGSAAYFVHRYAVVAAGMADCTATVLHGERWVAGVERQNVFGVQFHPEKSGPVGAEILKNFLRVP